MIKNISIIGLGLMGGSLAAACRKKFPKAYITGISRDTQALRFAKKKGWIHESYSKFGKGDRLFFRNTRPNPARFSNLVILCTPVETFPKYLTLLDKFFRPGTLVTDVGSVKGEILNWCAKRRFKNIQFVGAHPVAGSHLRGIKAARPDLYEQGFTFVVKAEKGDRLGNPSVPFFQVKKFWEKICPRVIETSADEHDKIVSAVSHLPHAAAVALILSISAKYLKYAGAGFFDTTRIAAGHPSIWLPIFLANRKNMIKDLKIFERTLTYFRSFLEKGQKRSLLKMLEGASTRRHKLS
ncbi:MAG: prephenate dehydrogenase [Candidatus Omnitrophica bacterium]|nr:prephenate dehydrogenase [Candidatus Omnitrophota bacterium]